MKHIYNRIGFITNSIKTEFGYELISLFLIFLLSLSGKSDAQAPAITSISPVAGSPSSSVTINGTGFNNTMANNIVYFGATKGNVTAASSTSLAVTVPYGATFAPVFVTNTASSLSSYSNYPFLPTYDNCGYLSNLIQLDQKVDFDAGFSGPRLVMGDIDGDGKMDMVVANTGSSTVSIYRNISSGGSITTGSFAAKVDFTTPTTPVAVALSDLDGDGKLDIIVVNLDSTAISVFRNISIMGSITSTSLATRVDYTPGSIPVYEKIAINDLDRDGKPDLVIVNDRGFLSVIKNNSIPGSISLAPNVDFLGLGGSVVAIADIDGDGKPDLIAPSSSRGSISMLRNISSVGSITSASFATKVDFPIAPSLSDLAICDIDGDGKQDIVTAVRSSSSYISVLKNNSSVGSITSSSFASHVDFYINSQANLLAIGDINGDGKPDIAVSGIDSVYILLNAATIGTVSSSSLTMGITLACPGVDFGIGIGDADFDGKSDLVVSLNNSSAFSIFRNNPLSTITGTATICIGDTTALADAVSGGIWNSSDSSIATVNSAGLVSGIAAGVVTISYTTISCVATRIVTVGAVPVINAGRASVICNGSSATLVASGATTYVWSPSSGLASLTGNSVVAAPSVTVTYTVTGTSSLGCSNAATETVSVNALTAPTISVTSGIDLTLGSSTTLTATGGSGYLWSPSAGLSAVTGANVIALPIVTTTYTVTGNDTDGCTNTATVAVTVRYPLSYASIYGSGICAGSLLAMSSSMPFDTVIWKVGSSVLKKTVNSWNPTVITIGAGSLVRPNSVFVAKNGDLYVTDATARVTKYSAGFTSSTLGTIVAKAGITDDLSTVFVDSAGYIYVGDGMSGHILQYPPSSDSTTIPILVGDFSAGYPYYYGDVGDIAVDQSGNIFAVDLTNQYVVEFSPSSIIPTIVETVMYGALYLDPHDTFYLAIDFGVYKFSPLGAWGTYGLPTFVVGPSHASGLWLDSLKSVYVTYDSKIIKFTNGCPFGTVVAGGSSLGSGTHQLNGATHTHVDADGNLYIADRLNNRIQIYNNNIMVDTLIAATGGNYTATVKSRNGCVYSSAPLVINSVGDITGSTAICLGDAVVLSDTSLGTWSSSNPGVATIGSTSGIVTSISVGTTLITFTAISGCTKAVMISVNALPGISAGSDVAICSSSAAILPATGGATYSWSPATGLSCVTCASVVASPTVTTTYTVTGTNSIGCSNTATATITVNALPSVSTTVADVSCNGGSNGSISTSVSGGAPSYTYAWSIGATTAGISGRAAGTFSVTVTDANGCASSTSATIGQPTLLTTSSSNTAILCNGGASVVTVSASGGTLPYSGTGAQTPVGGGSYSYMVTDANGCTASTSGTISEPTLLTASASNTAILCNGGTSVVTVSASGGTSPYSGTGAQTPANAASYSYTVTDANGCTASTSGSISQPTLLTASSSNTAILCNGGTSVVTVSVSGGTSPYSGTGAQTPVTAGSYSYTVTDANGCTASTSGSISEPTLLTTSSSNTAILCNGGTSVVTVSASGGTSPYSGTGAQTPVTAGSYSYTITDANGCTASTSGSISEPTALAASSTHTSILCNGGTSVVTVSASGGTSPYSGTGAQSPVTAGSYSYTVTDANGCTASTSGTISEPTLLTASSSNTAILCNGGTSVVTVSAAGGTSPYSGTGAQTPVTAGSYSYTVTDVNGCTASTSGSISQPTLLTASSSNTAILCNGGSSVVTVSASGGTSPYSGTGAQAPVSAGSYSYTVTDANGCTASTSGSISEPTLLTASSTYTPILCNGGTSVVTVSASGGTSPYSGTGAQSPVTAGSYSYTVTDANGCTASTSGSISQPTLLTASSGNTAILCNGGTSVVTVSALGGTSPYSGTGAQTSVSAGSYSYTVTDANGCTASTSGTISQPTVLTVSATHTSILCNGGTSVVTVSASGGTSPYSGTGAQTPVSAGSYSYTVTDGNGCAASASGTISQPTLLTASSTNTAILCNGGTSVVTVSASGGTSPYSGTGAQAPVSAGSYSYTVTDANGCTASTSGTVTQPTVLSAGISASPVFPVPGYAAYTIYLIYGAQTETLSESVTGGTPAYTYSWAPVSGTSSTLSVSPTATTAYTVTVTDANGCTTNNTQTINVVDLRCCPGSGGGVCTKVSMCRSGHTTCVDTSRVAGRLAAGDLLNVCGAKGVNPINDTGGSNTDAVKVYPNPTGGIFSVEIPAAHKSADIQISDVTGRTIETRIVTNNIGGPVQFDLGKAARGVYTVRVRTSGKTYVNKLVMN